MRKSSGSNPVYMLGGSHQGSTSIAVQNGTGTVSRQLYTPFGAPRGAANQLPGERGFLGQVEDDSTGLVYLNARYYDATLMRFVSPDPLFFPYNPRTLDGYAYALNNPLTVSDPSGLSFVDMLEGGGGVGFAGGIPVGSIIAAGGLSAATYGVAHLIANALHNILDDSSSAESAASTPYIFEDAAASSAAVPYIFEEPALDADPPADPGEVPGNPGFPGGDPVAAVPSGPGGPSPGCGCGPGSGLLPVDPPTIYTFPGGGWTPLPVLPWPNWWTPPTVEDWGLPNPFPLPGTQGPTVYNAGGESDAARRGRDAHKNYNPGDGFDLNKPLPSGARPDAVNWKAREVRELKPDTPSGRAAGRRQLRRYLKELNELDPEGGHWTGRIDYY